MTRRLRIISIDLLQHCTHRGNDGRAIFCDEEDRLRYVACAAFHSLELAIRIIAYVLMDNHVHWLLFVHSAAALSAFFRRLHSEHAIWMNAKYGTRGHLFGERFYSGSVDLDIGLDVVRYIELNPVRARMVPFAESFVFSSARSHVFGAPDRLLGRVWAPLQEIENYGAWLREVVPDAERRDAMIRWSVRTGRTLTKKMLLGDPAEPTGSTLI